MGRLYDILPPDVKKLYPPESFDAPAAAVLLKDFAEVDSASPEEKAQATQILVDLVPRMTGMRAITNKIRAAQRGENPQNQPYPGDREGQTIIIGSQYANEPYWPGKQGRGAYAQTGLPTPPKKKTIKDMTIPEQAKLLASLPVELNTGMTVGDVSQGLQGAVETLPALGNWSWKNTFALPPETERERVARLAGFATAFPALMSITKGYGINPAVAMGGIGALQEGTLKERTVRGVTMAATGLGGGMAANYVGRLMPAAAEGASLLSQRGAQFASAAVSELPSAAVGAFAQPAWAHAWLNAWGEPQPDITWDEGARSFWEQYVTGLITRGFHAAGDAQAANARPGAPAVPAAPEAAPTEGAPAAETAPADPRAEAIRQHAEAAARMLEAPVPKSPAAQRAAEQFSAKLNAILQGKVVGLRLPAKPGGNAQTVAAKIERVVVYSSVNGDVVRVIATDGKGQPVIVPFESVQAFQDAVRPVSGQMGEASRQTVGEVRTGIVEQALPEIETKLANLLKNKPSKGNKGYARWARRVERLTAERDALRARLGTAPSPASGSPETATAGKPATESTQPETPAEQVNPDADLDLFSEPPKVQPPAAMPAATVPVTEQKQPPAQPPAAEPQIKLSQAGEAAAILSARIAAAAPEPGQGSTQNVARQKLLAEMLAKLSPEERIAVGQRAQQILENFGAGDLEGIGKPQERPAGMHVRSNGEVVPIKSLANTHLLNAEAKATDPQYKAELLAEIKKRNLTPKPPKTVKPAAAPTAPEVVAPEKPSSTAPKTPPEPPLTEQKVQGGVIKRDENGVDRVTPVAQLRQWIDNLKSKFAANPSDLTLPDAPEGYETIPATLVGDTAGAQSDGKKGASVIMPARAGSKLTQLIILARGNVGVLIYHPLAAYNAGIHGLFGDAIPSKADFNKNGVRSDAQLPFVEKVTREQLARESALGEESHFLHIEGAGDTYWVLRRGQPDFIISRTSTRPEPTAAREPAAAPAKQTVAEQPSSVKPKSADEVIALMRSNPLTNYIVGNVLYTGTDANGKRTSVVLTPKLLQEVFGRKDVKVETSQGGKDAVQKIFYNESATEKKPGPVPITYGTKSLRVVFEDPTDRAAYLSTKKKLSASDKKEWENLMRSGMTNEQITARGNAVRSRVKDAAAKAADGETIRIKKSGPEPPEGPTGGKPSPVKPTPKPTAPSESKQTPENKVLADLVKGAKNKPVNTEGLSTKAKDVLTALLGDKNVEVVNGELRVGGQFVEKLSSSVVSELENHPAIGKEATKKSLRLFGLEGHEPPVKQEGIDFNAPLPPEQRLIGPTGERTDVDPNAPRIGEAERERNNTALQALITLQKNKTESERAIAEITKQYPNISTEELVKRAVSLMHSNTVARKKGGFQQDNDKPVDHFEDARGALANLGYTKEESSTTVAAAHKQLLEDGVDPKAITSDAIVRRALKMLTKKKLGTKATPAVAEEGPKNPSPAVKKASPEPPKTPAYPNETRRYPYYKNGQLKNAPSEQERTAIINNVVGKTAAEAARWMADNSPSFWTRLLAHQLHKVISEHESRFGIKTLIRMNDKFDDSRGALAWATFAFSDAGLETRIVLNGPEAANAKTLMHELVHIALDLRIKGTSRWKKAISAGSLAVRDSRNLSARNISPEVDAKLSEIQADGERLTDAVIAEAKKRFGITIRNGRIHVSNPVAVPIGVQMAVSQLVEHGWFEFITHATTNRDFQVFLDSVQYRENGVKNNAMSRLVELARQALDLPIESSSALYEAISLVEQMILTQTELREGRSASWDNAEIKMAEVRGPPESTDAGMTFMDYARSVGQLADEFTIRLLHKYIDLGFIALDHANGKWNTLKDAYLEQYWMRHFSDYPRQSVEHAHRTVMHGNVVHWTNEEGLRGILADGHIVGGHVSTSLDLPFDVDNNMPFGIIIPGEVAKKHGYEPYPTDETGVTALEIEFAMRTELEGQEADIPTNQIASFVTRSWEQAGRLNEILQEHGLYHTIKAVADPKYSTLDVPENPQRFKPSAASKPKPAEEAPAGKRNYKEGELVYTPPVGKEFAFGRKTSGKPRSGQVLGYTPDGDVRVWVKIGKGGKEFIFTEREIKRKRNAKSEANKAQKAAKLRALQNKAGGNPAKAIAVAKEAIAKAHQALLEAHDAADQFGERHDETITLRRRYTNFNLAAQKAIRFAVNLMEEKLGTKEVYDDPSWTEDKKLRLNDIDEALAEEAQNAGVSAEIGPLADLSPYEIGASTSPVAVLTRAIKRSLASRQDGVDLARTIARFAYANPEHFDDVRLVQHLHNVFTGKTGSGAELDAVMSLENELKNAGMGSEELATFMDHPDTIVAMRRVARAKDAAKKIFDAANAGDEQQAKAVRDALEPQIAEAKKLELQLDPTMDSNAATRSENIGNLVKDKTPADEEPIGNDADPFGLDERGFATPEIMRAMSGGVFVSMLRSIPARLKAAWKNIPSANRPRIVGINGEEVVGTDNLGEWDHYEYSAGRRLWASLTRGWGSSKESILTPDREMDLTAAGVEHVGYVGRWRSKFVNVFGDRMGQVPMFSKNAKLIAQVMAGVVSPDKLPAALRDIPEKLEDLYQSIRADINERRREYGYAPMLSAGVSRVKMHPNRYIVREGFRIRMEEGTYFDTGIELPNGSKVYETDGSELVTYYGGPHLMFDNAGSTLKSTFAAIFGEDPYAPNDFVPEATSRFLNIRRGEESVTWDVAYNFEQYINSMGRYLSHMPFLENIRHELNDMDARGMNERAAVTRSWLKLHFAPVDDPVSTMLKGAIDNIVFESNPNRASQISFASADALAARHGGRQPIKANAYWRVEAGSQLAKRSDIKVLVTGEDGVRLVATDGPSPLKAYEPVMRKFIRRAVMRSINAEVLAAKKSGQLPFGMSASQYRASLVRGYRQRGIEIYKASPQMALRSITYMQHLSLLAYNFPSAIGNWLSPLLTLGPEIGFFNPRSSWSGVIPQMAREAGSGIINTASAMVRFTTTMAAAMKKMTPAEAARWQKAVASVSSGAERAKLLGILSGEIQRVSSEKNLGQAEFRMAGSIRAMQEFSSRVGPLSAFTVAEDFTRGVAVLAAEAMARRMGLRSAVQSWDATPDTPEYYGTMLKAAEAIRTRGTAERYAARLNSQTMFDYNRYGKMPIFNSAIGRLFGVLTTWPTQFASRHVLRPAGGLAKTVAAGSLRLVGKRLPTAEGVTSGDTHAKNAFDKWLRQGGASGYDTHGAAMFVRGSLLAGFVVGATATTGVNFATMGTPGYDLAILKTLMWLYPNDPNLKKAWVIASRAAAFNPERGLPLAPTAQMVAASVADTKTTARNMREYAGTFVFMRNAIVRYLQNRQDAQRLREGGDLYWLAVAFGINSVTPSASVGEEVLRNLRLQSPALQGKHRYNVRKPKTSPKEETFTN